MNPLPRINKRALLHATVEKLRPKKATQLYLFGQVKQKRPITKEDILAAAFGRVQGLAMERAYEIWSENKRKSYNKAQKDSAIRLLAAVYTWPEVFDGRRGFASEKDAYLRKVHDKQTGKAEPHKGVDAALYKLAKAGLTITDLQRITREILFNHIEEIKHAELDAKMPNDGRMCATRAAQLYADKIKPALIKNGVLHKLLLNNEEKMAAIDHNIIFILYLGMKREHAQRKRTEVSRKIREQKDKERAQTRKERLFGRRDVQEEMAKDVPFELIAEAVPKHPPLPKKTSKNRFR